MGISALFGKVKVPKLKNKLLRRKIITSFK